MLDCEKLGLKYLNDMQTGQKATCSAILTILYHLYRNTKVVHGKVKTLRNGIPE